MVIFHPKLFRRKVAEGAKANCPRPLVRFHFLISKVSKISKLLISPHKRLKKEIFALSCDQDSCGKKQLKNQKA